MFLTLSRGRKASESVKNISFCGNLLIGEASLESSILRSLRVTTAHYLPS